MLNSYLQDFFSVEWLLSYLLSKASRTCQQQWSAVVVNPALLC